MRALQQEALCAIARHDREVRHELEAGRTLMEAFTAQPQQSNYVPRVARNITRFYKWLVAEEDGDVSVRTVAVKSRKDGTRVVKEVVRASVDKDDMYALDIVYAGMSGYVVDWSPQKLGRALYGVNYGGRWQRAKYSRRGKWMLRCAVINPELLGTLERFRYCAWSPACGEITGYLKTYAKNPRVELLAKAGLGHLARLSGFCARMSKNKALMSFVARNRERIEKMRYGADVVSSAFKLGLTLDAAQQRLDEMRVLRGHEIPACVDKQRAGRYVLDTRGVTGWEYAQYLEQCVRMGHDPRDTKVSFPKDFHARARLVQDLVNALERKNDAAKRRKHARELARRAKELAGLERAFGAYAVRIPSSDADFKREGGKLHHCVGSFGYQDKMARGECVIVFVRKAARPNTPFVTVELSGDGGAVRQCYGKHNSRPDDEVLSFVKGPLLKLAAKCVRKQQAALKSA